MTRQTVDVLFINPGDRRQVYQSLGDELCAIEPPALAGLFAGYLRNKGATVAILDAPALGLSAAEAVGRAVSDYRPALVVLAVYGYQPSASTQNMPAAGVIARGLKEADPSLKVLMTGTHPAALPERTMREEAVDFVCDLEGPVTLLKTLNALKAGGGFADVPSLWWRDGATIKAPTAAEPLITDLDGELPGIAWDLLPMDRYRAHNWHCFGDVGARKPYASIHTSLGCPYQCSFCCINAPYGKSSYRMWSPEAVVTEIAHLVETYGVRNLKFVDEMFVLNERHVLGICDGLIARGFDLNIWAYARVDTVKPHMLGRLRQAGVRWLALGIESGSKHVRDGAAKALRNEDIVGIVRMIQEADINVIGNYIFGLPDDDQASMRATLDLARDLNCEFANFYSAMAYPGSALHRLAEDRGWALPPTWSAFSQHSHDCLPLPTEHLSAAEVLRFRDEAFHEYFSHPAYLAMVERRFGPETRAHIADMTTHRLRRKIVEDAFPNLTDAA
ncbi:MAG: B12-binding domain-containing radical SAM protein [Alphaproteobacteria bacterium]